jgi:cytochrome b561
MTKAHNRYSAVAITLHWAIAALILFNLYLALQFDGLRGLAKFNMFQLHKSVGLTVLLLSLARLAWRLTHRPPPLPAEMPRWEKFGAQAAHWLLYGLMIGIPLTGWVVVSASPTNLPTVIFKTVPWPHLGFIHDLAMPVRRSLEDQVEQVHMLLGYSMACLIVLHVAAALKHQFWNRDGVLGHMLPFARPKSAPTEI